jgi:hypothetical protein
MTENDSVSPRLHFLTMGTPLYQQNNLTDTKPGPSTAMLLFQVIGSRVKWDWVESIFAVYKVVRAT